MRDISAVAVSSARRLKAGLHPALLRRRSRCWGKKFQRLLNVHSSGKAEEETSEEERGELRD